MQAGEVDAFITVSGYPNRTVSTVVNKLGATLVPVDGAGRDRLMKTATFYTSATIPVGSYSGQSKPIETVAVPALWLSRTDVDQDLLQAITKAFWSNPKARGILDKGHPKGKAITLQSAFSGVSVPLCPGSEKYYKEAGILK